MTQGLSSYPSRVENFLQALFLEFRMTSIRAHRHKPDAASAVKELIEQIAPEQRGR